jgi:RNA-directed DNA polymerase
VLVRYADDSVAGFEYETDAKRFLAELRERLEKFALSLHPDKTRLIEFGRFAAERRARRGLGKPETFNFLGFTQICGHSRAGYFLLKRKTRRDRMRVRLRAIKEELRRRIMNPFQSRADGWGKWCVATLRTMRCQPTLRACVRLGTTSLTSGGVRFGDAARGIAQRGIGPRNSWQHFCLPCE